MSTLRVLDPQSAEQLPGGRAPRPTMYLNDRKRAEKNYEQAKALVKTPAEKDALKRYENVRKERMEFWKSINRS